MNLSMYLGLLLRAVLLRQHLGNALPQQVVLLLQNLDADVVGLHLLLHVRGVISFPWKGGNFKRY